MQALQFRCCKHFVAMGPRVWKGSSSSFKYPCVYHRFWYVYAICHLETYMHGMRKECIMYFAQRANNGLFVKCHSEEQNWCCPFSVNVADTLSFSPCKFYYLYLVCVSREFISPNNVVSGIHRIWNRHSLRTECKWGKPSKTGFILTECSPLMLCSHLGYCWISLLVFLLLLLLFAFFIIIQFSKI